MGTAGGSVLGEPVGRRRSRLRTHQLIEAAAVALGYAVAVLREGAPATGGGWALVAAGAVAVAVPLWVKSRRELRQETETRSAETLAIETDAKLRLVVGDVVTPIAEVVGRVHQTSGRAERDSLRGPLKRLVVEAVANLCDGERARAVFFQLERGRCGPRPGSGGATRRPRCSPTTRPTAAARRRCCWSGSTTTCWSTTSGPRSCPGGPSPGPGPATGPSSACRCSAASRTWAC